MKKDAVLSTPGDQPAGVPPPCLMEGGGVRKQTLSQLPHLPLSTRIVCWDSHSLLGGLCSQQVEVTGIWSSFSLPGPQRRQNCGGLPSPRGGGNTRLLSALGSDRGALWELYYLTQAPSPTLVCTLNSLSIVTFLPACLHSRGTIKQIQFSSFQIGFSRQSELRDLGQVVNFSWRLSFLIWEPEMTTRPSRGLGSGGCPLRREWRMSSACPGRCPVTRR